MRCFKYIYIHIYTQENSKTGISNKRSTAAIIMDITYISLVTLVFAFAWYYFSKKNSRKKALLAEFPGPKDLPIIGTILPVQFMRNDELFSYARNLTKTYGPIFRQRYGNIDIVSVCEPKYIELILSNTTHLSKGFIYNYILLWLGDGLLTSTGEKWHRHRKLLTPTFHFKILESFMEVFVEKSEELVKILEKEANGKPFNVFPYITHCALDIICETAMGIQVNAMSRKDSPYIKALYGISDEIIYRLTKVWLSSNWVYFQTKRGKKFLEHLSVLHNTTNRVIAERKKVLAHKRDLKQDNMSEDHFGGKKRKAFLDLLIEFSKDGEVLTDTQIREEVDTFLFEGHDTTTASISWTIFLLGLHPDIQERAYEEVSQVLQDNQSLTFANLNELKYLERIIKESLRLYPSVANIGRIASKDIKMDKYTVPAGTFVLLLIYDTHRNEEYFPDPLKFDPDRFLPENTKDRHPYAYIPFSAGPRNCIGQKFALYEEKTILSYIIKNFKIKSMQTMNSIKLVNELIVRPLEGINVILEKRT